MPSLRHPKGTQQGGQYAPGTRAVDPQTDPLRLSGDDAPEATSDEVVSLRSDIPAVLARYGTTWKMEPHLSVTPVGVLARMSSSDTSIGAEIIHHKAVNVVAWGTILANMLNANDLSADDAASVLEHVVDYDYATHNQGRRMSANPQIVLDALPGALQNARPFLAVAYLETKHRIASPDAMQTPNSGELLLNGLLDIRPTTWHTMEHALESASGMRFMSAPRTQWAHLVQRFKAADAAYRQTQRAKHMTAPYAAPNSYLLKNHEIGTRFGTPNCFAKLYERYQAVGLPPNAFLDELQVVRAFIAKARDLRGQPQMLTDWWQAQKAHLRYHPSTLEMSTFCDLYVLHGGNPTPEGADAAAALNTVWDGCQNDDTKRDMIEMVLLPGCDGASSPDESARYIAHQRGIRETLPSPEEQLRRAGALNPVGSGVQQRWGHFATFLSNHSETLEDARRYAQECAPGMAFP